MAGRRLAYGVPAFYCPGLTPSLFIYRNTLWADKMGAVKLLRLGYDAYMATLDFAFVSVTS